MARAAVHSIAAFDIDILRNRYWIPVRATETCVGTHPGSPGREMM